MYTMASNSWSLALFCIAVCCSSIVSAASFATWASESIVTRVNGISPEVVFSNSGLIQSQVLSSIHNDRFVHGDNVTVLDSRDGSQRLLPTNATDVTVLWVGEPDSGSSVVTLETNFTCVSDRQPQCMTDYNASVVLYALHEETGTYVVQQKYVNYTRYATDQNNLFPFGSVSPDGRLLALFCLACGPGQTWGVAIHSRPDVRPGTLFGWTPQQRIAIGQIGYLRISFDELFACVNASCLLVPVTNTQLD